MISHASIAVSISVEMFRLRIVQIDKKIFFGKFFNKNQLVSFWQKSVKLFLISRYVDLSYMQHISGRFNLAEDIK